MVIILAHNIECAVTTPHHHCVLLLPPPPPSLQYIAVSISNTSYTLISVVQCSAVVMFRPSLCLVCQCVLSVLVITCHQTLSLRNSFSPTTTVCTTRLRTLTLQFSKKFLNNLRPTFCSSNNSCLSSTGTYSYNIVTPCIPQPAGTYL